MAAKWYRTAYGLEIRKDPGATRDYSLSWVDRLSAGQTVSSVVHTVPSGITKVSESVNVSAVTDSYGRTHPIGTITIVRLSAGTAGARYQVVCRVTFSNSEIDEQSFFVNMDEL